MASTNTKAAIELMSNTVFDITRGDRRDSDNIGVLFSDGGSTKFEESTKDAAAMAKNKGKHYTLCVLGLKIS